MGIKNISESNTFIYEGVFYKLELYKYAYIFKRIFFAYGMIIVKGYDEDEWFSNL